MHIRGLESHQLIAIYLDSPVTVMDGKLIDATMLCNLINQNREHNAKLSLDDKGQITSKIIFLAKNLQPLKEMIDLTLNSCCALFEKYSVAMIAITTKNFKTIRDEEYRQNAV